MNATAHDVESKENSDQRWLRYFADARQFIPELLRKQITGKFILEVDLNAGHPRRRTIQVTESKT